MKIRPGALLWLRSWTLYCTIQVEKTTTPFSSVQSLSHVRLFATKDGETLYSEQKQDWELTGLDHGLLIGKFSLKLKKVGKTTRPLRYDLNHIPYEYSVEVRNRFNGLDLINRLLDKLWMEVCEIVQETGFKTIAKKKKCKNVKWLSEEAVQISV